MASHATDSMDPNLTRDPSIARFAEAMPGTAEDPQEHEEKKLHPVVEVTGDMALQTAVEVGIRAISGSSTSAAEAAAGCGVGDVIGGFLTGLSF